MLIVEAMFLFIFCAHRKTKVFLHCDESVSTPIVTTQGDSREYFNYVSGKNLLSLRLEWFSYTEPFS